MPIGRARVESAEPVAADGWGGRGVCLVCARAGPCVLACVDVRARISVSERRACVCACVCACACVCDGCVCGGGVCVCARTHACLCVCVCLLRRPEG